MKAAYEASLESRLLLPPAGTRKTHAQQGLRGEQTAEAQRQGGGEGEREEEENKEVIRKE